MWAAKPRATYMRHHHPAELIHDSLSVDDVGFEDESENVYEEDFDVEEERTELSVSRYDIPDVFTQKGSQGKSVGNVKN